MDAKETENIVLKKLNIGKKSALNILANKELCDRIINETPIDIKAVSEYGISVHSANACIEKGIISCFQNVENRGSKMFIFKEEVLRLFKLNYKPNYIYITAEKIVQLYLLRIKDTINERQFKIVYDILINKKTMEDVAKEHDITPERARQIFTIANRRVMHSSRIETKYFELKSKYFKTLADYEVLQEKLSIFHKDNPHIKLGISKEDAEITELLNTNLRDMDLTVRALNCLKASDIELLWQLVSLNINDLLKFRNFGKKSLTELTELVSNKGLQFGMNLSKYKPYLNPPIS